MEDVDVGISIDDVDPTYIRLLIPNTTRHDTSLTGFDYPENVYFEVIMAELDLDADVA